MNIEDIKKEWLEKYPDQEEVVFDIEESDDFIERKYKPIMNIFGILYPNMKGLYINGVESFPDLPNLTGAKKLQKSEMDNVIMPSTLPKLPNLRHVTYASLNPNPPNYDYSESLHAVVDLLVANKHNVPKLSELHWDEDTKEGYNLEIPANIGELPLKKFVIGRTLPTNFTPLIKLSHSTLKSLIIDLDHALTFISNNIVDKSICELSPQLNITFYQNNDETNNLELPSCLSCKQKLKDRKIECHTKPMKSEEVITIPTPKFQIKLSKDVNIPFTSSQTSSTLQGTCHDFRELHDYFTKMANAMKDVIDTNCMK